MEKQVKNFSYLKERKFIERLDVLPFLIIHSLCMIIYTNDSIHHLVRTLLGCFITLLQLIVFFSKFWSENLSSKICYKQVKDINQATHVRVDVKNEKFQMINRTTICPIIRQDNNLIIINFEKINYQFEGHTFIKEKFKLLGSLKLEDYKNIKPYNSAAEIKSLTKKFGKNLMKIPIPSFFSLYKEHIVAPFFVFQIFCILLWVFDDYGLHSAMSLTMLCLFEATVVGQRIVNLVTLRQMRVPPHQIFVYRNDAWVKIVSSELLPGDVVSVVEGSSYVQVQDEADPEESGNVVLNFLKKIKEAKKKAEEKNMQKSLNTVINKHKEKEPNPLTCDMLILNGSAIVNESMLTGESVPLIKDSIYKMDHEYGYKLDTKLRHKNCILFAGTKVVKTVNGFEEGEQLPVNILSSPPDKGAICLVIKTGFSTSQGKLLRTVMYSSDRTGGDSRDAFIFIFILLFIAIIAAYYVLIEGIEREGEITYKLLLRCIIILTSVVPAELPIELSLAINNSLFYLQSKRIVCIEPFRIPLAGKIDVCCFDKTGTLTTDEFVTKGVATDLELKPITSIDENTLSIITGCNSLIQVGGKTVGDPIELATFKAAGGSFNGDIINNKNRKIKLIPIRRYPFESTLKRMSVLLRFYSEKENNFTSNRIVSKGAPEVMKNLFNSVPENYDITYNNYAKQGFRILALGYQDNEEFNINSKREDVEKNLIFCGFVIVETPLKNDTIKQIKELVDAKLDVAIITGDHHLTTAKVAADLKIGPDRPLFIQVNKELIKIQAIDLDGNIVVDSIKSVEEIINLRKNYILGITGNNLDLYESPLINNIINKNDKHKVFQHIQMYCRVTPIQKDDIVKALIKSGNNPSMCGDGSNDVGALKRAVIGVALLNVEENEATKNQPFSIFSLEDESTIKSGDVTAASPFTSKSGSIACVKNILMQGRCTLVITFQMYKILALNCLLSAYSLSVLALKGVKFSDYQSTYMGFAVAFFFLNLSKGEPLKKLNKYKPDYSIFTVSNVISIVGQAITHLTSLFLILSLTELYDPVGINYARSLDDEFAPTLMNTIIFIYSFLNNTINFVVNYQGEPFMKNMTENTWLMRLVFGIIIFCTVIIYDLYPPIYESLQLLPLPDDIIYKHGFVAIMACDFLISYILENWKKLLKKYD